LHTAQGAAMLRRLHKSEDTAIMNPTDKLRDIAKRYGIGAIAKSIVEDDHAYSITEHELTDLVIECAKRDHPGLSDAQAFTKVFTAQDEGGIILRKAFNVVKSTSHAADVDDSAEAYRELEAIGKRDYPGLSSHEQFAKAFEAHPELAKRAHRRPSAGSTSFPYPKF